MKRWSISAIKMLSIILIAACSQNSHLEPSNHSHEHEELNEVMELLTDNDIPRSESYQAALNILHDLGVYGFDQDNLSACKNDDLKSHYLQRQLPNDLRKAVQNRFKDASGEEIFNYLVNLADKSEEQINNDLNSDVYKSSKSNLFYIDMESSLLMHLIWLAAEKGNIDALNEIGAAQIYCYQDTEQDIENAVLYLKKAAHKGDILANMTLGKIYHSGLGGFSDKTLGKKYRDIAFSGAIEMLSEAKVLDTQEEHMPKNPLEP
jgi:hypothetical protein